MSRDTLGLLAARRMRHALAGLAILTAAQAQPATACDGDCDGDTIVTVDEIVRMVGGVLSGHIAACPAGDSDGDQVITVDEVITAVNSALYGCTFVPPPGLDAIRRFPGVKLEVGEQPVSLALTDLDGDGQLDIGTANSGSEDVSLLLRTPNGGFERRIRVPVGRDPRFVAPAEVGAERSPVLLAAGRSSDELAITSVRNGIVATQSYAVGDGPVAVTTADLNSDSVSDVVVLNHDSSDVSVLLGDPHGAFAPEQRFPVGVGPLSLAAADIDGDLVADIIVANRTGTLTLLSGTGKGDLAAPEFIDIGLSATVVAIGDLNNDRVNDLIVVGALEDSVDTSSMAVLLGRGDGSFSNLNGISDSSAQDIAVADIDGDQILDLVSAGDAIVSIFFGHGDGSFTSPHMKRSGCSTSAVAVADLDNDGARDIVYTCDLSDEVSVLWNLGERELAAEQLLLVGGMLPTRVLAADVDADGATDLATVNQLSNDISILRSAGNGTFGLPVIVPTQPGLLNAALGNLDDDEAADLVISHETSTCRDCIVVLRSNADGSFEPRRQLSVPPRILALAITDLDRNVAGDIIGLGSNGVSVLAGLGEFEYAAERRFAVGIDPRAMSVTDLNGDGSSDVATANAGSNDVSVLLSLGDGDFGSAGALPLTIEPSGIATADVDVDGHIDLVVRGGGQLSIFFGRGDGTFSGEQRVAISLRGGAFVLGDVDADGLPDLVTIAAGTAVYRGAGNGSFAPGTPFAGNPLAVDLQLLDVNIDGALDVVTANATVPGSISLILGIAP